MNPHTGHLTTNVVLDLGYYPVPDYLRGHATKALGGRKETHVNLKAETPLAKWAATKRRNKRRAARHSRKVNR